MMDRRDFLASLGIGVAVVACANCLQGCSPVNGPNDVPAAPTNVNMSLDLTTPVNSALNTNGGYVYNGGLIIARTSGGSFIALSQACTHQGGTVQYRSGNNTFYCPVHGSVFAADGSVINGPASRPLAKYATSLSGTVLKVTS
jgi:cytochrome b6-f complex iron-sulfur subunit